MPILSLIFGAILSAALSVYSVDAWAEGRFSESYSQLRRDMLFASENSSRGLTIIHRWARDYRHSPSLISVGYMKPHEFVSGKRFADFIYAKYGLSLILVADYEGFTVPGFDGLVVDKNLKPVANISLKTLSRPHLPVLWERSEKGFYSMEHFSEVEKWIHHVSAHRATNMVQKADGVEIEFRFHQEKSLETYRHTRDSALDLVAVLAPGSSRPNWLVVDIGNSDNLKSRDFRDYAYLTRENESRQAILMTEDEEVKVFEGHIERAPLPKKCVSLLKAG